MISGSETILPAPKPTFGPFLHQPQEGTIKHYALEWFKSKSEDAFLVAKKLFRDPETVGTQLYSYLNLKKSDVQLPKMEALALLLEIDLSKDDYEKLKLVLDTFIGTILPCYTVLNDLKNDLLAPIETKITCDDFEITCPMKDQATYHLENLVKTENVSNILTDFTSRLNGESTTVTVVYSSGK